MAAWLKLGQDIFKRCQVPFQGHFMKHKQAPSRVLDFAWKISQVSSSSVKSSQDINEFCWWTGEIINTIGFWARLMSGEKFEKGF